METVGKPPLLSLFDLLSKRKMLSNKENKYYLNLKKGYEGEVQFLQLLKRLKGDLLVLTDLLLEYNQATFQIDCLIITRDKIYLYEIKNYEGDFYLEAGKFYKKPHYEVINPLHQLSRTESLLRQLLLSINCTLMIESFVVFVNPTFTLYQTPLDSPFIFPSQLHEHLNIVNSQAKGITNANRNLSAKLLYLRKEISPYMQLPIYEYEELKKGISCKSCRNISVTLVKRTCVCEACGDREPMSSAILRSIREFQLLFPEKRLTTNQVYDWCRVVDSKKAIRRVLKDNYQTVGKKQWTYYV